VISPDHIRRKKDGPIPFDRGDVWVPEGSVGVGWDFRNGDVERQALQTVRYPD
jgi:hypothetical protein